MNKEKKNGKDPTFSPVQARKEFLRLQRKKKYKPNLACARNKALSNTPIAEKAENINSNLNAEVIDNEDLVKVSLISDRRKFIMQEKRKESEEAKMSSTDQQESEKDEVMEFTEEQMEIVQEFLAENKRKRKESPVKEEEWRLKTKRGSIPLDKSDNEEYNQIAENQQKIIQEVERESREKRAENSRRAAVQREREATASTSKSRDEPSSSQREREADLEEEERDDATTTPSEAGSTRRTSKPPPISVFNIQIKKMNKLLESVLFISDYYIKKINDTKFNIILKNIEDFVKVTKLLTKTKTEYYTYTPKDSKKQSFVLKGLGSEFEPEEIKKELLQYNGEKFKVVEVSRFVTARSKANKVTLPIFVVQLSANSSAGKLHNIKYLSHQVVRWEKLKKKDVMQCKNCQRYGHAAANCEMDYRCVKCAENHQPGQCAIPKNEDVIDHSKIYCVMCSSYGHPASYKGCKKYLEMKQRLREKINFTKEKAKNRRLTISKFTDNYVQPGLKFSDIIRGKNHVTNNNRDELNGHNSIRMNESRNNDKFQASIQSQINSLMAMVQKNMESITFIMQSIMPIIEMFRDNE